MLQFSRIFPLEVGKQMYRYRVFLSMCIEDIEFRRHRLIIMYNISTNVYDNHTVAAQCFRVPLNLDFFSLALIFRKPVHIDCKTIHPKCPVIMFYSFRSYLL